MPSESQIQALYRIKGIQVKIGIADRTSQRISKDINNEELKKYVEKRLSSLLKEDRDIVLFHTSAPILNIRITIEEKKYKESSDTKAINKFLYYADIEATTQRGKYKWLSEQSCSWQKKTDNSIKKLESLIALKKEVQDMSAASNPTHNYTKDAVNNIIKSDYKLLYEKKRRLTFQYAIEQTLNEIVDNFAGDYVLTKGLPDGLEYQPGYEEETVSLQQKDERYVESKTLSRANILYEKGNTIKLRNPTDTVFALYKDDSLSNITNLFSNGIKASIIDYKALPDKPVVYKIQIPLKDGSEYIGWVPESVISK